MIRVNPIRKFIDYVQVFIEVNTELINSDKDKKKRNKKTRRYPITKEFIEATDLMQKSLDLLKEIKVISLCEIKRSRTMSETLKLGKNPPSEDIVELPDN